MYPRSISFEKVRNFRDLGGYRTRDGRRVAWRRVFRSGELRHMTPNDAAKLKNELQIRTVLDLRNPSRDFRIEPPTGNLDVRYFTMPLDTFSGAKGTEREETERLFDSFTNCGQIYSHLTKQPDYAYQILKCLVIIAEPGVLPLVFHCNAGKDRSGILAAIVLGVLGVSDQDIIDDYVMSAPHMQEFVDRWNADPVTAHVHASIQPYRNLATTESITVFLANLRREYGSCEGYLAAHDAEPRLVERLKSALLV